MSITGDGTLCQTTAATTIITFTHDPGDVPALVATNNLATTGSVATVSITAGECYDRDVAQRRLWFTTATPWLRYLSTVQMAPAAVWWGPRRPRSAVGVVRATGQLGSASATTTSVPATAR